MSHDFEPGLSSTGGRRLRIAQVAPPLERVPPSAYGGTERIVHELTTELVRRGHEVTVFASADSIVPCRLVATVETPLRPAGIEDDSGPAFERTLEIVLGHAAEFDVIHSHLEQFSMDLVRRACTQAVSEREDLDWKSKLVPHPATEQQHRRTR